MSDTAHPNSGEIFFEVKKGGKLLGSGSFQVNDPGWIEGDDTSVFADVATRLREGVFGSVVGIGGKTSPELIEEVRSAVAEVERLKAENAHLKSKGGMDYASMVRFTDLNNGV